MPEKKQYNYFRCAKDNQEFLSSANRPRCPTCGTHKVNPVDKKVEQAVEIVNKNEVKNMPKEKKPDEENNKKPIDQEDDDDSFTIY